MALYDGTSGGPFVGTDAEDTVTYANAGGSVTASLATGGTAGEAAGDTYSGIESLAGSPFDDTLAGDAGDNSLLGGDGDDIFDANSGGRDILIGHGGVDTAVFALDRDAYYIDQIMTSGTGGLLVRVAPAETPDFGETETRVFLIGVERLQFADRVFDLRDDDYGTSYTEIPPGEIAPGQTLQGRIGDRSDADHFLAALPDDSLNYRLTVSGEIEGLRGGFIGWNAANGAPVRGFGQTERGVIRASATGDYTVTLAAVGTHFEADGTPEAFVGTGSEDTVAYTGAGNREVVRASLLAGEGWDHAAGDTYQGIENLTGGRGSDLLIGDHGDNRLDGGAGGWDTIAGNGGDDYIAHARYVIFGYASDQYEITSEGDIDTVRYIGEGAGDGTDTVNDGTFFRFADSEIETTLTLGQAYEGTLHFREQEHVRAELEPGSFYRLTFDKPGEAGVETILLRAGPEGDFVQQLEYATGDFSVLLEQAEVGLHTAGDDWILYNPESGLVPVGGAGRDMLSFAAAATGVSIAGILDHREEFGDSLVLEETARLAGSAPVLIGLFERITGSSHDDVLSGFEQMRGLGGDDTFILRDWSQPELIRADGGSGHDTFVFQHSVEDPGGTYWYDDTVSLFRGTAVTDGYFVASLAGIEEVRTGGGDDRITGDHADNVLFAYGGDDTLMGNGGDDYMHGGAGTDTALFGYDRDRYDVTTTGGRTVVEYIGPGPGDGTDTLDFFEVLQFADGDMLL